MGREAQPQRGMLIISVLYNPEIDIEKVFKQLTRVFGPIEQSYGPIEFTWTTYYNPEMGEGLMRFFLGFSKLIKQASLATIKRITNRIEKDFSRQHKRKVNLDPGVLTLHNLVLPTTKAYTHRPVINGGIYADLMLVFNQGEYAALPWTYPDYASEELRDLFTKWRPYLKRLLKGEVFHSVL